MRLSKKPNASHHSKLYTPNYSTHFLTLSYTSRFIFYFIGNHWVTVSPCGIFFLKKIFYVLEIHLFNENYYVLSFWICGYPNRLNLSPPHIKPFIIWIVGFGIECKCLNVPVEGTTYSVEARDESSSTMRICKVHFKPNDPLFRSRWAFKRSLSKVCSRAFTDIFPRHSFATTQFAFELPTTVLMDKLLFLSLLFHVFFIPYSFSRSLTFSPSPVQMDELNV